MTSDVSTSELSIVGAADSSLVVAIIVLIKNYHHYSYNNNDFFLTFNILNVCLIRLTYLHPMLVLLKTESETRSFQINVINKIIRSCTPSETG